MTNLSIYLKTSLLTSQNVETYLQEEGLKEVPDVTRLFKERGDLSRYFFLAKEKVSRFFLGRVVLRSTQIGLGLTALIADVLGFRNVFKKMAHQSDLLHIPCEGISLLNPLVRTINYPKEVDLTHEHGGICAGSSIHFSYIYSQLREKVRDQKQLLIQCADLFAEGGGEAAFKLHMAFGSNFFKEEGLLETKAPLLRLVPDDDRSSLQEGQIFYRNQEDLRKLIVGTHIVRIYNSSGYHAISLIKISNEECYIFDPQNGLFELQGANFPDGFVRYLNTAYRYSHKYHYLRCKRRAGNGVQIQASELREMYVQILPLFNKNPAPPFPFKEIPKGPAHPLNRGMGCLEYVVGTWMDSWRASR